ncbi:hypothetical protein [Streptomyces hygroscopicus]|uniref:hypothetical protein n=1 Tax=Streptomyces hygroscopicus TaxID=1912 RepID=UPI003403C03B
MTNNHSATADWYSLTQILGHSSTWPESWHTTLAQHGQAALLQQAARDFSATASTSDEHLPVTPTETHRLAA